MIGGLFCIINHKAAYFLLMFLNQYRPHVCSAHIAAAVFNHDHKRQTISWGPWIAHEGPS